MQLKLFRVRLCGCADARVPPKQPCRASLNECGAYTWSYTLVLLHVLQKGNPSTDPSKSHDEKWQNMPYSSKPEYFVVTFLQENALKQEA